MLLNWLRPRLCALRASRTTLVIVLAGAGAMAPSVVAAEGVAVTADELRPGSSDLANPSLDLLVLRVEETHGGGRLPLAATVRIVDVIRGRLKPGDRATASWGWQPSQENVRPPEVGTEFLAVGFGMKLRGGERRVKILGTYAASSQNLSIARRHMARPPRSPWPLIALPVVGWGLLIVCAFAKRRWRALLAAVAVATALAEYPLYYRYERHMSYHYTIRIDLLLIWPALLASLAIPVGAWVLLRRPQAGRAHGA